MQDLPAQRALARRPGQIPPAGELQAWLERDPLPSYRRRLGADGVPEATLDAIEHAAMEQVEQATEICKASPAPALATAFTDLWADGRNSMAELSYRDAVAAAIAQEMGAR